eukprot:COSAG02_NODE_29358_length_570_cov_3.764331_1_plen_38_part_10
MSSSLPWGDLTERVVVAWNIVRCTHAVRHAASEVVARA